MGHFLLSAVLLADAIVLYHRAGIPDDMRSRPAVKPGTLWLGRLLVLSASVVLVTGTVVTGAGPHSGDAGSDAKLKATRLDIAVPEVARIHGTTVMVFLALTLIALWVVSRQPGARRVMQRLGLLLVLIVAQGALGYTQYFNGVPAAAGGLPRRGGDGGVQRHPGRPPEHVRTGSEAVRVGRRRRSRDADRGHTAGSTHGNPTRRGRSGRPRAIGAPRFNSGGRSADIGPVASRSCFSLRALALLTAVGALAFGLAAPAGAAPSDSSASGTRDLNVLNERYNLTRSGWTEPVRRWPRPRPASRRLGPRPTR